VSANDHDSVQRAARAVRATGAAHPFSLNEALRAWRELVTRVEKGYTDNIYEYTNDLHCRDALATAWPILSENLRVHRQPELDALDARFEAATDPDDQLAPSNESKGWWWRRVPRRRVGELADDLD
jgi:hypothetical protein